MKVTKFHVFTKTCFQIFLYVLEISFFCGLLTYLSFLFIPLGTTVSAMDIWERFTLFYVLYQMLVCMTLTNINDIKADEYLALHSTAESAVLAIESNSLRLICQVQDTIDKQLDSGVFNDMNVRKKYHFLSECVDDGNLIEVRQISIWSGHCAEASKLDWRFSFLLRIFK